jgi:hypothetical protein
MATTANKPLVCKLTTPELRRRRATVIADLKSLVLARGERNDGYSYRFEGTNANLDRLTEFIKTERMCCDFFTFQLTVDETSALLEISGPPGAKEFLDKEVGL